MSCLNLVVSEKTRVPNWLYQKHVSKLIVSETRVSNWLLQNLTSDTANHVAGAGNRNCLTIDLPSGSPGVAMLVSPKNKTCIFSKNVFLGHQTSRNWPKYPIPKNVPKISEYVVFYFPKLIFQVVVCAW